MRLKSSPPYNNSGLCNKTVPCTFITLPLTVILALPMCYIHLTGCLFAAFFCTTCHFKVNLCCCTGICMFYLVLGNMSCLICCACALYMFHRGRVGNVLSIPLYALTCEEIDNKATLTITLNPFSNVHT